MGIEVPSPQHRRCHRSKIIRRDREMRGAQFFSRWLRRLTDNRKRRRAVIVGKRHGKRRAGRFYSGQRAALGQRLFEELSMFLRLWIFRFWQNEFSDERVLRIEARLSRAEIGEAF